MESRTDGSSPFEQEHSPLKTILDPLCTIVVVETYMAELVEYG